MSSSFHPNGSHFQPPAGEWRRNLNGGCRSEPIQRRHCRSDDKFFLRAQQFSLFRHKTHFFPKPPSLFPHLSNNYGLEPLWCGQNNLVIPRGGWMIE